MAAFIKRTRTSIANPLHLQFLPTAHTPDFTPPATNDWIQDPDLTAVSGVDRKYWETSVDLVVEMDQAGKDAVDAHLLAKQNTAAEDLIRSRLGFFNPLEGIPFAVTATGLTITANINSIVDDLTIVTAHAGLEKFFQEVYMYTLSTDSFSIEVFEKTNGEFDDPTSDEKIVAVLANYSLAAMGTELVEI